MLRVDKQQQSIKNSISLQKNVLNKFTNDFKCVLCNKVRHRGVIMKSAFLKEKFSQYLCFTLTIGSNDLVAEQEYTEQQHQNYELIKSLHDGGMGYRKIAKYLNEQSIKTNLGNTWKNTQVFSVLKKYRARQERIQNVRLREHPIEISKFELQWMKDI